MRTQVVDQAIKDPTSSSVAAAIRAIVKSHDIQEAFRMAVELPKMDRKDLERLVIQHGTARDAYQWALTFPDADLTALARVVAPSFVYSVEFERQFGSIDNPRRPQ